MKSKLFTLIFLSVFFISFASALFERSVIDETLKEGLVISESASKYPAIEINGFWDGVLWIEDKRADITLTSHDETCQNCISEWVEYQAQEGALVEDFRALRLINEEWVSGNLRWYQLYYYGDVKDYETVCEKGETIIDEKNGTEYTPETCIQREIGIHQDWIAFSVGDKFPAGKYQVKLIGEKRPDWIFDWQIKKEGVWVTELATWGNISLGDEAEVTLNSPADNSIQYVRDVNLTASANVTNGAYLTNATLFTNETGSWGARNVTDISPLISNAFGGGSNSVSTYYCGYKFTVNKKVALKSFSGTSTEAKVFYYTNGSLISTSSGKQFSNTILETGVTYFVLSTSKTPNQYVAASYSTASTDITYTKGVLSSDGSILAFEENNKYTLISDLVTQPFYTTATINFTNIYLSSPVTWNYQFCDTDGACGFATSNRTFSIDSVAPTLTLNYPTSLINYGAINGTLQLNFTATDSNLANVWYNYNGTNVSIAGAVSGVENLSNITLSQKKNVTIYANDTAGNLNATVFSWDYTIMENSRSYNATSFITTVEQFKLNISHDGSQIPLVYLIHNGTSQLTTLSNGEYITNKTMNVAGNNTFYWSIQWGSQVINTTSSVQTVSALTSMSVINGTCSAGMTQVMNLTFADESNLTTLSGATLKYNIKYGISNSTGTSSYGTLSNVNQTSICLNVTQSPTYLIGYGELEYSVSGYTERRFYLFENTRLSNVTINTTLYSLPNAQSTSFLVEIRNTVLAPYTGKYTSLLRWYPNLNEYRVVEMGRTDDKGQTVKKVKIEDIDYRIGVYETDGTLIHLANPMRMVCLISPCSYTLTIKPTDTLNFDESSNVQAEITWDNSTGTFTLTYNDPSQNTDKMELKIYQIGGISEDLICNSSSTAFTGIITCNVSGYDGTLKAVAVRSAPPFRELAIKIIDTIGSPFQGTFGLFIQMIITLILVLLGIVSPIASIILGFLSLVIGVMVFKTITYPIMVGIGVLGGLVIYFARRSS